MSIKPLNRHLVVEVLPPPEKTSAVLLPEEFKEKKSRYVEASVVSVADDCKPALKDLLLRHPQSRRVIIQSDMVDDVSIGSDSYKFILENHVLGIIEV